MIACQRLLVGCPWVARRRLWETVYCCWFESIFIGKNKNNEKFKLRMFCYGDPGYKSTAKLICESALCLALNRDNLPNTNAGGVLTTSTGLGSTLIDRLKNADVLFEGPSKI